MPGEDFGRLRAKRQSPRKLLRRLSAADEVEKELDDEERRPAVRRPTPTRPLLSLRRTDVLAAPLASCRPSRR